MKRASFKSMETSTAADWAIIREESAPFQRALPDRLIAHLKLLEGDYGGFPVDRYTHSLQTATRALRDGRDEEYVVCALLHDIGDTLSGPADPEWFMRRYRTLVSSAARGAVLEAASTEVRS